MPLLPLPRWLVPAALVAGGVGITLRKINQRRAPVAAVAGDLHHPMLYLDFSVTKSRDLKLLRRLPPPPEPAVAGILTSERTGPAREGRPEVSVRLHEPTGRTRPSGALLWIHGGGMVMGRPEQDDFLAGTIAKELGVLVVATRYRFAPEHPYPAQLNDCADALNWLHTSTAELGVDPRRIAVGGSSAGGGLAAALSLRTRDEGGPSIAFQLLNYPKLDDRTVLRSDHGDTGKFVWTPESNRFAWTSYLGGPPQPDDDRIYAIPARAEDLAELPPAWVGVGDLDLFHAEGVDYAQRLEAADVPCELLVVPGMYHAADGMKRNAPSMVAYRQSMIDALRPAIG